MKPVLALILTLFTTLALAQVPDSISVPSDSLRKATIRINNKIDSAQLKLNGLLNPDLRKLTSRFKAPAITKPDSLSAVHELDSLKSGFAHKIDSLKGLNLSAEKYTRKLDSLNQIGPARYVQMARQRRQELQNKLAEPAGNVTRKINQPIDNIEGKVNEKLNVMRQEGGEGANLPGNVSLNKTSLNTDLPAAGNVNIPGSDINNPLGEVANPLGNIDNPVSSQTGQLGELTDKAGNLTSIPQQQVDKLRSIDQIQEAKGKVDVLNQTTDKVQAYGDDVSKIAQGDVGDIQQIPETIEGKARSLDEIKELEKQTGELNKAKEMIDMGNNPDALKAMAKKEVVKQATDHFAGKQAALQAAMEKVSKLKSKYGEVKSLADLPKRPPNPMNGKPVIERIIPGLTFQLQKGGNVLIDLNPVVSYRFTGRINAGLGWNERLSFVKWNKLSIPERIYGPRVYGTFAFWKGFAVKTELEKMNALIPPYALTADAGTRQWVWSAFVGIKKDYPFLGKVKGNVQMLYNLYDDHDNSPYSDRLVVRMGFEFPMKKKPSPPKN